jgi:hypothetical protein
MKRFENAVLKYGFDNSGHYQWGDGWDGPMRILRLSHGQRWREEEMRACDVIYGQAQNVPTYLFAGSDLG